MRVVVLVIVVLVVAAASGLGLCSSAATAQEVLGDQTGSSDSALPSEVHSGLSGRVVLASRCPVPLGGDEGTTCPSVPLATVLAVRSADGSTEVAQVASNAEGQFWVPLDPGQYLIEVPAAASARSPTRTLPVTVTASGPTALTIELQPSARP